MKVRKFETLHNQGEKITPYGDFNVPFYCRIDRNIRLPQKLPQFVHIASVFIQKTNVLS